MKRMFAIVLGVVLAGQTPAQPRLELTPAKPAVRPDCPDISGRWGYYTITQHGRYVFFESESYVASGEWRHDGKLAVVWTCYDAAMIYRGVYEVVRERTEDGNEIQVLVGRWAEISWSDYDGCDMIGNTNEDRYIRTVETKE